MHLLISAYSARNRSDLLVFSQKATPKNWRMERYVVTFCQKRFPSQFPPMYRVETQWWRATAARCPSRWTNTPNQWNPQINERFFPKKNVMSQSPHETEHCKNKKTLENATHLSCLNKKIFMHPWQSNIILNPLGVIPRFQPTRAFFLGRNETISLPQLATFLGAKRRSYWASSEVSGDEAWTPIRPVGETKCVARVPLQLSKKLNKSHGAISKGLVKKEGSFFPQNNQSMNQGKLYTVIHIMVQPLGGRFCCFGVNTDFWFISFPFIYPSPIHFFLVSDLFPIHSYSLLIHIDPTIPSFRGGFGGHPGIYLVTTPP